MKKIVTLLLLALSCTPILAQRGAQTTRGGRGSAGLMEKSSTFFLGLKGGADFTSMTQPDECDLYDGMGLGYNGGLAIKARFGKASSSAPAGTGLFGVGLEVKYKQNVAKTIGIDEDGNTDADLKLDYLEVPLLLQFHPFFHSDAMNNFYIEVGPDFATVLSRSPKQLTANTSMKGDYSQVTYNIDTDGSTLKGTDVRLAAGLGYDFAIKNSRGDTGSLFGINARYYLGNSKLAGNFNSKMSTIEVSLSWLFSIGKL